MKKGQWPKAVSLERAQSTRAIRKKKKKREMARESELLMSSTNKALSSLLACLVLLSSFVLRLQSPKREMFAAVLCTPHAALCRRRLSIPLAEGGQPEPRHCEPGTGHLSLSLPLSFSTHTHALHIVSPCPYLRLRTSAFLWSPAAARAPSKARRAPSSLSLPLSLPHSSLSPSLRGKRGGADSTQDARAAGEIDGESALAPKGLRRKQQRPRLWTEPNWAL